MKLYDMLDNALYFQEVWIFEHNAYDQNMPLFKGTVNDARQDVENVWNYLMCEVEFFDCSCEILDIRVRNEQFEERFESHYFGSDRWGEKKEERPWRHSIEISQDKSNGWRNPDGLVRDS